MQYIRNAENDNIQLPLISQNLPPWELSRTLKAQTVVWT